MNDTYDLSDLEMLAKDCLTRAGVGDATARVVAQDVALAEAYGDAESGFEALLRDIRLVRYGRIYADAKVNISTPTPAVIRVDAGHGFAAFALAEALPSVIEAALSQGLAMVHLTRASDPGSMARAMAEIAAAPLAAVGLRPHGKAVAIRPMGRQVLPLDTGAQTMLSSLLTLAPPTPDMPLGGPVEESSWLTVLDPTVTAAEELLSHLPDVNTAPAAQGIAVAPELLAQIVNA
ncbi:Ldh family oxidoreductase [Jannaschia sp. CCS1]|uniref:Ldh family oxidoreductase n=1 Tax=Jannaschia sp. (strain CCS1) TaxID=290400 RepID=UPI000053BCBD|nr:Ldh family oxidoreductase [Jannaschia sp. CCS1]ABD56614.1 Malate/L-lactate dehydrogenases-like protein [Jannaschia sp. CCS1]